MRCYQAKFVSFPEEEWRQTWHRKCLTAFPNIVANTGSRSLGEVVDGLEHFGRVVVTVCSVKSILPTAVR